MTENKNSYRCETVLPYNNNEAKRNQVEKMFDNIASYYDNMNRTMTMGLDLRWRRTAIESLRRYNPQYILDVATGTGDFAIACAKQLNSCVEGIDISDNMLQVGRQKIEHAELKDKINLSNGDCMKLAFGNETFDAVTVAFGVRNFGNLEQGVKEMSRVLKKGGHLIILEMSEPYLVFKPFYRIYTQCVIPILGRKVSADKKAYTYLPNSIEAFPKGNEVKTLLKTSGFSKVKLRRFTFGVCSFFFAEK